MYIYIDIYIQIAKSFIYLHNNVLNIYYEIVFILNLSVHKLITKICCYVEGNISNHDLLFGIFVE